MLVHSKQCLLFLKLQQSVQQQRVNNILQLRNPTTVDLTDETGVLLQSLTQNTTSHNDTFTPSQAPHATHTCTITSHNESFTPSQQPPVVPHATYTITSTHNNFKPSKSSSMYESSALTHTSDYNQYTVTPAHSLSSKFHSPSSVTHISNHNIVVFQSQSPHLSPIQRTFNTPSHSFTTCSTDTLYPHTTITQ